MIRIPFVENTTFLYRSDTLILKGKNGKERKLKPAKWWINKNTPVGEDANLFERKPYDGNRYISWKELIAIEREEIVNNDLEGIKK